MLHSGSPFQLSKQYALIGLSCIVLSCSNGWAQSTAVDVGNRIGTMEMQLFSTQYASESPEARIARIEQSVFGQAKSGDSTKRVAALEKIMKFYTSNIPAQTQTQSNTQADNTANEQPSANTEQSTTTDGTDYPTVTSLERIVFARDFIRDTLTRRLDRLEQKVWGQTSPQMDLADRVDRLVSRYPQATLGVVGQGINAPKPSSIPEFTAPGTQTSYIGSGIYTKLDALEFSILGPNNQQSNKLLTERLDLLERQVFGYAQSGTLDSRVDKLIAAHNPTPPTQRNNAPYITAQSNSYKTYPSYGSVNTYRESTQYGTGGFRRSAQSTQISGIGSLTQAPSQYSQDIVNMLPNDVRQRVNNGVVVPGNGSVTMTETLIQPSTVQRLPNGVQVYTPERTYQQTYQLTPTVLPAPEQYQVYQQQGTQMIQPKMNSRVLANESAQQLDTLETKVFGKPNQSDTLEIRLWKLESQMSGQTYGGYTPEARISNLWKIYQYQYLGNILQNPQKP